MVFGRSAEIRVSYIVDGSEDDKIDWGPTKPVEILKQVGRIKDNFLCTNIVRNSDE